MWKEKFIKDELAIMVDPRGGGLHNPNMAILYEYFDGDELLKHMEQEFRHEQFIWMAWFEVSSIGKEVVFTWIGRTSHLYLVKWISTWCQELWICL